MSDSARVVRGKYVCCISATLVNSPVSIVKDNSISTGDRVHHEHSKSKALQWVE